MKIIIDLENCENERKVLLKIEKVLYFGGPDDIVSNGWGLNWDALKDCLCYLDTGGIWGNSPKFKFPLKLIFVNYKAFKKTEPDKFKILKEILKDTKKLYLQYGKNFFYIFE